MKALFCHTVRMLVRQRDILIWVIVFPLILSSLFHVMFAHFDEYYRADPVACIVVDDGNYRSDAAFLFRQMIDELSAQGDGQLLQVSYAASEKDARARVLAGDAACFVALDDEALPALSVSPLATSTLDQSIVKAALDEYRHVYGEMKQLYLEQAKPTGGNADAEEAAPGASPDAAPDAGADAGAFDAGAIAAFAQSPKAAFAAQAFLSDAVKTREIDVLRTGASGTVRYYYALLGFAAVMSITVALTAVSAARANTAAVGARRQVSALSPTRQLAIAMGASAVTSFSALLIAFAFMRFALGVEFGGREGLAVLALFACSIMATGLGSIIGAVPKIPLPAKMGIATGSTCLSALFAGLYGEPAMQLADQVARDVPWLAFANPAVQAANAFYDLTYYDSLQPFFLTLGVLAAMALVFFAIAALLMRRQSYERL